MDREQPSEVERLNWTPLGMREYKDAVYVPRFVREQHYDALAARLAEAERERDEWHARAIALFWKGDADGATVGHVRSATAAVKQLLAQDRATDSAPTSPKGNPCLTPDDCLRAADGTECWPCDHATPDSASAVQPERCCLDYPRCDCNSPPEPDNEWHCSQYPGCECFAGCREKALEGQREPLDHFEEGITDALGYYVGGARHVPSHKINTPK